jgi:hypothetical protein
MKKQSSFIVLMVCLLATISSVLNAKTLQPIYLDKPEAAMLRSVEMSEEQTAFFAQYEYAMQQVAEGADMGEYFMIEAATDEADSVPQLLGDIMYDQGEPYNWMCPKFGGQLAATGCVATAMAQIMRYYTFPERGTGTVTYTGTGGAKTINLADYEFDWDDMLNTYKPGKYTDAQGNAVAELMLACGAALNMNYGVEGSGSHLDHAMLAFKKNFGYSSKIGYFDSSNSYEDPTVLIEEDWAPTIRKQHRLGFPVMYAGSPASGKGGHAFVIDGYKVIDGIYYYHVNWGWSGMWNGYYLIMNLKPEEDNYAGASVDMVINIYPEGMAVENVPASSQTIDPEQPIYTILGTTIPFDKLQPGNIYVQRGKKFVY